MNITPTDYGIIGVVLFLLIREIFGLMKHFGDKLLSKRNGANGYKDVWALHFEKSLDKLTTSIDSNTKVNIELAQEIRDHHKLSSDILSILSKQERVPL